ncbi:DUF1330 domain-containing protein [Vibrio spartinae]|uniref:DUF1330 domain-containing protein n=1 Tax=Vibrio spartinae TaxID=1918945 RepID=A0A1N6M026_9VIBR|nr:DUF1330 domain-containing protein [Vibrio spartinae]SIO92762.1 hypothetical protein VSP9026_00382 [Vibrio spartinae]
MPKGYLIAHLTVINADLYAEYGKAAEEAVKPFNPKIVAWTGQYENLEGEAHQQHMIFEFSSFTEAKRFYDSDSYQAAKKLRAKAATGTFVLIEGFE